MSLIDAFTNYNEYERREKYYIYNMQIIRFSSLSSQWYIATWC